MNKDVIYIEPEDDITDIINRLKAAKKKVVALVPPKKLGVLRSSVNAKLIAKAAKQSEKVAVIITNDSSLIKIAGLSGLPIAKTLESRPIMPEELKRRAREEAEAEQAKAAAAAAPAKPRPTPRPKKDDEINLNSAEIDAAIEREAPKQRPKSSKSQDVKIPSFEKYRKWILLGAAALILIIVTAVMVVSGIGSATISVNVKASDNNFAENISLVTSQSSANPESGRFYLEKVSFDGESTTEFTATGERNDGEKAKGIINLRYTFSNADIQSVTITPGTVFMAAGLNFYADESETIAMPDDCTVKGLGTDVCAASATVNVVAENSGEKYNLSANQEFQNNASSDIRATNATAFSGGTDKIVKIVTEKDIENAKNSLSTDADAKTKLLDQVSGDVVAIESSFKVETGNAVSTPAVNEPVADNAKAKLTAKSTYSIFAIDKTAIEKFIRKQVDSELSKDQKIYSIGKPFLERFVDDPKNYTAKLKTTYKTGPIVTEQEIMEKSKGKKVGDVTTYLESIKGVQNVSVTTDFFWVHSIPNDENKVKIEIKVEE